MKHPQSDQDEQIGPMPGMDTAAHPTKKPRILPHRQLYLTALPSSPSYVKSYMHREHLSSVHVSNSTDFIITTSMDGYVKFWQKTMDGIVFVKQFRAHPGRIAATALSADGLLFASVGVEDRAVKCFDVANYDMVNMVKVGFEVGAACFVYRKGDAKGLLALGDQNEAGRIVVVDVRGTADPVCVVERIHHAPVHIIQYHEKLNCVVSCDTSGMVEVWTLEPPHGIPSSLGFSTKSETDLYEFKKAKAIPLTVEFSPDGSLFATTSTDRQVRVFKTRTCRLYRKYDESLKTISDMQQTGTAAHALDAMEFGRRLAVDRDMEKSPEFAKGGLGNVIFDESGHFILYSTLHGIKLVNLTSNKVEVLFGASESPRFLHLALYQGATKKKAATSLALAASDNPTLRDTNVADPTLFCTAYKRNRFYMFTRKEPEESTERDVFNEKPTREEQSLAVAKPSTASLPTQAVLRTTLGDIHLVLFPDKTPKTVENFSTHAKSGYYDGVIFHRVMRNFMIQTGDPLGTGTGGESIWGGEFEDEIHPDLKHDVPYTLSMANAGPGTNASQFFITTVATPWLDGKHTVFGRATAGMDVIHAIECLKTNRLNRPHDEVKIISIDVR